MPNEGRVEICTRSNWSVICNTHWEENDARVACRHLGYRAEGTTFILCMKLLLYMHSGAQVGDDFGQGIGVTVLDDFQCESSESSLLCCRHEEYNISHNCVNGRDNAAATVRCKRNLNLKIIRAYVSNTPTVSSVLITWELQNSTVDRPRSFKVECNSFSEQHYIMVVSVNNNTTSLRGLLPSTPYNCCISTVIEDELDEFGKVCTSINTHETLVSSDSPITIAISSDSKISNSVSGVLGFIIAILFILLTVSVVVLACWIIIRPKLKKRAIHAR